MSKVAAISTIDSVNYRRKGLDYDPFLKAFITGSNGIASDWDTEQDSTNTLVIRGLGGTSRKAIQHCWQTNRKFYAIDTGYFGNLKHKRYHRITYNALQNLGPIIQRPTDRLQHTGYYYKKPKFGSKILICPPSEKVMTLFNQPAPDVWVNNTIDLIKQYTDRPIEIRLKPNRSERVTTNTIQQALSNDVHCLVTFNSIAATEALMEGVPAITIGPNSAELICETNISNIENIKLPDKDQIINYLAHLSYAQFTEDEMQSGYAWDILQETVK